jgi:hypothetical protein
VELGRYLMSTANGTTMLIFATVLSSLIATLVDGQDDTCTSITKLACETDGFGTMAADLLDDWETNFL